MICVCVTVGLVGGGGSPPPGSWLCMLSPAGWLPRGLPRSAPAPYTRLRVWSTFTFFTCLCTAFYVGFGCETEFACSWTELVSTVRMLRWKQLVQKVMLGRQTGCEQLARNHYTNVDGHVHSTVESNAAIKMVQVSEVWLILNTEVWKRKQRSGPKINKGTRLVV